MQWRRKRNWSLLALACLMAISPGCVIRRGWVVKCDWTFEAHRTGCRHRWFRRCCRDCQASCDPSESEYSPPSSCQSCGAGGLFHREQVPTPPPAPEPPSPVTFHPVPTRPIYGSRAEEPDAYAAPMRPIAPQPLDPRNLDMDGEPIDETDPPPIETYEPGPPQGDEAAARPRNLLRSPAPRGRTRKVSWQAASTRKAASPATPLACPSCTVRFRD